MDKSHAQAQETRKRNAQARRERHERERSELEATINTLRQIRQNPKATPGEKLEAIKLLMKTATSSAIKFGCSVDATPTAHG